MSNTIIAIIIGFLVAPLVGGLINGLDRIITARLQGRIGPPVWQAFYDVIKLMSKESMVVNVWQAFCAFIQAVGAVFLVVGALSSTSPYSQVGAHRELLQILAYEPLIILVIAGIYLETGSFKISAIYDWNQPLILKLPFLFVALGYALTIKLRKSPFDLSTSHHGHQELVKGVLTDYSGPYLALIEIGHWYDVVLLLGFCSLFWATGAVGMLALLALTYFAEILIDNVTARMTWRWMLGYVWAMGFTLCSVNLIWVILG